ncbi:MAG: hypothetical protein AAGF99_14035 [Bacteroidota bacterium]
MPDVSPPDDSSHADSPPDESKQPPEPSAEQRAPSVSDPERLQRARARMETHAPVHLHELAARAEAQLGGDATVERGALMLALSAEHTHFFPGIGLFLPLPGGVAVAARPASETAVAVEVPRVYGHTGVASSAHGRVDTGEAEAVAAAVVRLAAEIAEQPVEAAVVLSVPACGESLIAAVAVAAVQAVAGASGAPLGRAERLARAQQVAEHHARRAFGAAACVAALDGAPPRLLLVDGGKRTSEAIDPPPRDEVVWGLVHVPHSSMGDAPRDFFKLRTAQVQAATLLLQTNAPRLGLPRPVTLRDIEHRHLSDVLGLVPDDQRPVVRHLVGEGQRVARMLMALRRRDGQVLGATLLVSHASLRDEWGLGTWGRTAEAVAFLREQGSGVEGIYGMRQTGTGGCVLVVGRPYLLPVFLDTLAERYAAAYGEPLHTLVL